MSTRSPSVSPLVLCLLVVITGHDHAAACSARRTGAPAIALVQQFDATRWRVCLPGYRTTAVPAGVSFCAAGLALPGGSPITSVDSLALHDESNGSTLLRYTWQPDAQVAAEFARFRTGSWTGFFGRVSGPLPGGVDHMLCFDLTSKPATSFSQMAVALKQAVVGTDESNPNRGLRKTLLFLMQPTIVVQDTAERHAKAFCNDQLTNLATRVSGSRSNEIFLLQPGAFRQGYGKATGWQARLQDEDQATSETFEIGWIRYGPNGRTPDVTPAGVLSSVRFELFGTGTGRNAVSWTLVAASGVILPRQAGIRMVLPKPRVFPGDGLLLLAQDGVTTKIPAIKRAQWTWRRVSLTPTPWLAPGSTFDVGGLFDEGISQVFVRSPAYGATRDLFGPESLFPKAGRDQVGFRVENRRFDGQFVAILAAPDFRATALSTPFGPILIENLFSLGALALDPNGVGVTPVVSVPPGLTFAVQSAFVDARTTAIRLSDALRVETQ